MMPTKAIPVTILVAKQRYGGRTSSIIIEVVRRNIMMLIIACGSLFKNPDKRSPILSRETLQQRSAIHPSIIPLPIKISANRSRNHLKAFLNKGKHPASLIDIAASLQKATIILMMTKTSTFALLCLFVLWGQHQLGLDNDGGVGVVVAFTASSSSGGRSMMKPSSSSSSSSSHAATPASSSGRTTRSLLVLDDDDDDDDADMLMLATSSSDTNGSHGGGNRRHFLEDAARAAALMTTSTAAAVLFPIVAVTASRPVRVAAAEGGGAAAPVEEDLPMPTSSAGENINSADVSVELMLMLQSMFARSMNGNLHSPPFSTFTSEEVWLPAAAWLLVSPCPHALPILAVAASDDGGKITGAA
jgi:hypothetical protein